MNKSACLAAALFVLAGTVNAENLPKTVNAEEAASTAAENSAGLVSAQELPGFELQEIIVTAQAPTNSVATDTINVKYVSPGKAISVPELLRQNAGIIVRSRSVYGDSDNDTVKLRALGSNRYNVLVDGLPVGMSGVMGGNFVDWNSIPIDSVAKVQIIKGAKSAAAGNVGGTINIITKKNVTGGGVTLLAGEQGRYEYRFNYGFNADKLNVQIGANKTGIDGYLLNNDYDGWQYGVKLGYSFSEQDNLRVGYSKTNGRRGYVVANRPGQTGYRPDYPTTGGDGPIQPSAGNIGASYGVGSYWRKDTEHYDISYRHGYEDGYLQFDYYKNNEKRREVIKDRNGAVYFDRVIPSDQSNYFAVKGQTELNSKHTLGYGADLQRLRYGYGHYNSTPALSELYPSQKLDKIGAYIDDKWRLDERWSAYLGLRYDKMRADKDDERGSRMQAYSKATVSPKFSLSLKSDDKNTSYLSINKVWRAPSMPEYYWWSQNYDAAAATVFGRRLLPEHGMSYELSNTHRFNDRFSTRVAVFYEDINDYINFRHVYPFRAYNVDNVKILGVELENELKLDKHNSLVLNYTNQHTEKSGSLAGDIQNGLTDRLDYTPQHKVGLSYMYDDDLWQVRYSLNYLSDQQESSMVQPGGWQIHKIGGYAVHNLAVTRHLNKNSSVSLFVDNLFDKEYCEQYDYPMSGRLISAAYTYRF